MDYASKEIYDFKEYVTRFDHSLTTALLTYKITKNKTYSLAALFHDVGSPCFSHVIDYMNKDYKNQESTEEYNEKIITRSTGHSNGNDICARGNSNIHRSMLIFPV